MLIMVHQNPVVTTDNSILIDRKFYQGMSRYCSNIPTKIVSVHPRQRTGAEIMDPVCVDMTNAPYQTLALDIGDSGRPTAQATEELSRLMQRSQLVYGQALGAGKLARTHSVPYIALVEYTLGTQLRVTTIEVPNPVRKAVRAARTAQDYYVNQRADISGAVSVHCNGYPIHDALKSSHKRTLLYLDSRMSSNMVIDADDLEDRMASRRRRRLKLIYSGRFARMKGVTDVVETGIALRNLGCDFELHLFGQGPEKARLAKRIGDTGANEYIHLHDAIPFPELHELAKSFDLFVCCHVQSDPSCTYLEAHGAGLAIAGYDNGMWRCLNMEACGGVVVPVGKPIELAHAILRFVNTTELDASCRRARDFALRHSFENEFDRRIADINKHLACGQAA